MTDEPFPSWEDRNSAASSLLDGACGWGQGVDQSDDEAVLLWARTYLPRMLALTSRGVQR